MPKPVWIATISNHAVVTKKELMEWLEVSPTQLLVMMAEQGLPPPRFGHFKPTSGKQKLPASCRWRAGDIRAWLEGSARLRKEMATEIGVERSPHVRALFAAGHDGMGGWRKPT